MSYLEDLSQQDTSEGVSLNGNTDAAQIESTVAEHESRFGNGFDPLETEAGAALIKKQWSGQVGSPDMEIDQAEFDRLETLRETWKRKEAESNKFKQDGNSEEEEYARVEADNARAEYLKDPLNVLKHLSKRANNNLPDNAKYSALENELIAAGNDNPDLLAAYRAASVSPIYARSKGDRPLDFFEKLGTSWRMYSAAANLAQSRELSVARDTAEKEEFVTDKQLVEGVPEGFHSYLLGIAATDGDYAALMARNQLDQDITDQNNFDRMSFWEQLGYGAAAFAVSPETYVVGGVIGTPVKAGIGAIGATAAPTVVKGLGNVGLIAAGGGVEEAILATPRLNIDQTYTPDDYMVDVIGGMLFTGTLAGMWMGLKGATKANQEINASNEKLIDQVKAKINQTEPEDLPQSEDPELEELLHDAGKVEETFLSIVNGELDDSVPLYSRLSDRKEVYAHELDEPVLDADGKPMPDYTVHGQRTSDLQEGFAFDGTQVDVTVTKDADGDEITKTTALGGVGHTQVVPDDTGAKPVAVKVKKYTSIGEVTKMTNNGYQKILKILRTVHGKDKNGQTTPVGFLINNQKSLIDHTTKLKKELDDLEKELDQYPKPKNEEDSSMEIMGDEEFAKKRQTQYDLEAKRAAYEELLPVVQELNATIAKIAMSFPDGKIPPSMRTIISNLSRKQTTLVTDNVMDRLLGGLKERGVDTPINQQLLDEYAAFLGKSTGVDEEAAHLLSMTTQEFVNEFDHLLYGQGIEIKKTNAIDADEYSPFIDDMDDTEISGGDLNSEDLANISTEIPQELSELKDIIELNKRYPDSEALRQINGIVAQRLRTRLEGLENTRYKDSTVAFAKKVPTTPEDVKGQVLKDNIEVDPAKRAESQQILKDRGKAVQDRFKANGIKLSDVAAKVKAQKVLTDIEQKGWKFYKEQRAAGFQELIDKGLPLPTKLSDEDKALLKTLKNSTKKVSEDVQLVGKTPEYEIKKEAAGDEGRIYEGEDGYYAGADDDTTLVRELKSQGKYMSENDIERAIGDYERATDTKLNQAQRDKLENELVNNGTDALPKEVDATKYMREPGDYQGGKKLIAQRNLDQSLIPRSMSRPVDVSAYKDKSPKSLKELNDKLKKEVLDKLGTDNLLRAAQEEDMFVAMNIENAMEKIRTQGMDKTLADLYETGDLRALEDVIRASHQIAADNAKRHRLALEAEKSKPTPKPTEDGSTPKTEEKPPTKEEILSKPVTEEDIMEAANGLLDKTKTPEEIAAIELRLKALNEKLQEQSYSKIRKGLVNFVKSGRAELIELARKPATGTDYVGRLLSGLVKEMSSWFLDGKLTSMKYIGSVFTETAAGFGGQIKRSKTAAILQLNNVNRLKATYAKPYNDAISAFVASKGRGAVAQFQARWGESHTNKFVAEFDRAFWTVIEYRRQGKEIPDSIHSSVVKFADDWQKFTDTAHDMAVKSGLNGFSAKNKVKHYAPHVWVQGKFKGAIRNHGIDKVRKVLIQAYSNAKEAGTSFVGDPAEMADILIKNVMGDDYNGTDMYSPLLDGNVPGKDARAKRRVDLDTTTEIDGLSILDLLDTEVINVANKYSNRMAGYSAIAEATDGMITSPRDLKNLKEMMIREGQKKGVKTTKHEKLFDDLTDLLLGRPTRGGLPQEMRQVKQLAFLTKLGGLGTAQLTETGQVITRAVLNMYSDPKVIEKITGMSRESPDHVDLMREVQSLSGISNELDLFHRESTNYDDGMMESISPLRRLSKYVTDKATGGQLRAPAARALTQGSLFNSIKRGQSRVVQASFVIDAAKHFKSGTGKMSNQRRADVGLTEPDGTNQALHDVFNNIVEYDEHGLPSKLNLEKWPPEAREEFALAMLRDEAQTIQKALVGELPAWLNSPFWGLVFQFRQFGMLAMNKQLRRSMAFGDKQAVFDTMLNTASAGLVRYAKFATLGTALAAVTGEEDPEENLWRKDVADVDLHKYVSQFGIYPDATDLVLSAKDIDKPQEAWDLLESEIPVLGVAHDYYSLATDDKMSEKVDALHGLTPLGNTAFGDLFYGIMEESLQDED